MNEEKQYLMVIYRSINDFEILKQFKMQSKNIKYIGC